MPFSPTSSPDPHRAGLDTPLEGRGCPQRVQVCKAIEVGEISLSGRRTISPELRKEISDGVTEWCLERAYDSSFETAGILLLERYESCIKRANLEWPSDAARHASWDELLSELALNARALEMSPGELVTATIANENPVQNILIEDEFSSFFDLPGIVRWYSGNNPMDPRGALRRLLSTVAELAVDPEFIEFRDSPSHFKRAVLSSPTDPRGLLRRALSHTDELMEIEPFASYFADNRPLVLRIALSHPNKVKTALVGIMEASEQIASLPEFREEKRWIINHAITHYGKNAPEFLRRVEEIRKSLARDPALSIWEGQSGVIDRAVVFRTENAREYLLDLYGEWRGLVMDPELAAISFREADILSILLEVGEGAKERLLSSIELFESLKVRDDLEEYHDDPATLWRAVMRSPRDPVLYLQRFEERLREINEHYGDSIPPSLARKGALCRNWQQLIDRERGSF